MLNSGTGVTTCTFSETDANRRSPCRRTLRPSTSPLSEREHAPLERPPDHLRHPGSKGALVTGDFSVSPGLPLYVEVGGLGHLAGVRETIRAIPRHGRVERRR